MKRSLFSLVAALALLVALAVPVAAHTQTVTPPGQDEPVVERIIARPWIQAHCTSAAPGAAADASGGIVVFAPQEQKPCSTTLNPGLQDPGP